MGENFPEFINKMMACAPLKGDYYYVDKLTFFSMMMDFKTVQMSVDRIKGIIKFLK